MPAANTEGLRLSVSAQVIPNLMVPAVKQELQRAEVVLGYETYVRMAGPFRPDQTVHMTDNREEMQRARHAFELAAAGRSVVMISSGDPGVFAMAAAVVEALHESENPAWHAVELEIIPGVSAALAAASRSGAPLGHDFCILSLSDNLKPWDIIEKRITLAAEADLAMAFYNPISKPRPWQLPRAIEILRHYRKSRHADRPWPRYRPARGNSAGHHACGTDPASRWTCGR